MTEKALQHTFLNFMTNTRINDMWKTFDEMTMKERYYLHLGRYTYSKWEKKTGKYYWYVR